MRDFLRVIRSRNLFPQKGKSHILRISRKLIAFEPENKGTNVGEALRYFNNVIKKRSVCFVISDFTAQNFDAPLKIANKKHGLVTIKIHDLRRKNYLM